MGTDLRRDWILHQGDRICCGKISYFITGDPIGYGGSAVIYPARRADTKLEYAIKECFPKEGRYHRPEGVILPRDPGDTHSVRLLDTLSRGILSEQRIGQNVHNAGDRAVCIREVLNPDSITVGERTWDDVSGGCFAVLDRVDQKTMSFNDLLQQIAQACTPEELERTQGLPHIHTTACIMEEVLMALEQVHTARDPEDPTVCGYYFGDLHGGNIYFSGSRISEGVVGTARLMDFGSARPLDAQGRTRVLQSEEVFSARDIRPPEMVREGRFRLGTDSDLYSAGCLMARCVLTELSLEGYGEQLCIEPGTITQADANIIGCRPEQLPLLSEILERATAIDRSARYQTAAQMLAKIRALKEQTAPQRNQLGLKLTTLARGAFVGRTRELRKLEEALTERHNPIVLHGFPGIGKTELAIEFGRRQSRWARVYFVRFAGSFRQTILGPIADAFSGYSKTDADGRPKTPDRICREVLQLLSRCARDDILIIDHADSHSGVFAELRTEEYHKLCALPMHLILTTRSEKDDVGQWQEIGPLLEEHQFQILEREKKFSRDRLKPLLDAVKGHTLMLELMSRTMAQSWSAITPEALLSALTNGGAGQLPVITTNHERSSRMAQLHGHLKALFDLSGMRSDEITVLCCATLLSNEGMDVILFKNALREEPGRPRNALARMLRGAPQPACLEQSALIRLTKTGWLTVTDQMLQIHPVVREVCRAELTPDIRRCAGFLERLWDRYQAGDFSVGQCARAARFFAAAISLPGPRDPFRASRAGQLFGQAGLYRSSVKYARQALDTAKAVMPEDKMLLATLYNNLGAAWGDLGDSDRELKYHQFALKLREKLLPPDHLDLAVSYSNLGTCYGSRKHHRLELEYQEKALQIRQAKLPTDSLVLADSYSRVGMALCNLGDHSRGKDLQLEALRIREDRLPSDDLALAASHNNLITPCLALRQDAEALEHSQQALRIRQAKLPPLHPDLAQAHHNTASVYRHQANWRKALEHYVQCLNIRREILEGNDPLLIGACTDVAECCRMLHDHERELKYIQLLLQLQKNMTPEDDAKLGPHYCNAADVCAHLGFAEQERHYLRKAAQSGHVPSMNRLAMLLCGDEAYREACFWLKVAVSRRDWDAACNLGLLYLGGKGVTRNLREGVRLLEYAAKLGNKMADWHLGRLFLGKLPDAPDFRPIDPHRALDHLHRAGDPGDAALIRYAEDLLRA